MYHRVFLPRTAPPFEDSQSVLSNTVVRIISITPGSLHKENHMHFNIINGELILENEFAIILELNYMDDLTIFLHISPEIFCLI